MARSDNKNLVYGEWWRGQSGLGKLDQNKFYDLDNCDIHSEVGLVQPQLALISDSNTPSEACFSAIVPTGDVYLCSKTTGKIWKRAVSDGTYSLVHTNTNTAHRGCRYFNGYLFYWVSNKLGYYDLSSTWSDSFATFTNSNARGAEEHANCLYILDGRYAARIDAANAFSANELSLPAQFIGTAIKSLGDDLLIGTYIGTNVSYCKVFLWDSVNTSWTLESEIFEIGVNCFIQLDGLLLAQCGTEGRFYYWSGLRMKKFGKIRGITTALGEQMSCVYKGRALFANANKCYSIHREDKDLEWAFCKEYTVTTGTIASLLVQADQLLVHRGTGVDKVGTSRAIATIETPEMPRQFNNSIVLYEDNPSGITISTKINNGVYATKTPILDTIHRTVSFDGGEKECVYGQAKITLTPYSEGSPAVEKVPKIRLISLL